MSQISDGHDFGEEDLLAYVNGTAPRDLAQRIEQRLENDADLTAEIALMRGVKQALVTQDANAPGEFGWRRLATEIERTPQETQEPVPVVRSRPRYWQAAAAVLAVLTLGQAGYIATNVASIDSTARYETATASPSQHVLVVGFAPTAVEADLTAALREADAKLIDGPSALGLYRVAFTSAEALTDGRQLLAVRPDLIDLIATD